MRSVTCCTSVINIERVSLALYAFRPEKKYIIYYRVQYVWLPYIAFMANNVEFGTRVIFNH